MQQKLYTSIHGIKLWWRGAAPGGIERMVEKPLKALPIPSMNKHQILSVNKSTN